MAYEGTEVQVSKSQDQIRRLIYAHKGSGLMLVHEGLTQGFEAKITLEQNLYHIRVMAHAKDQRHDKFGGLRTIPSLLKASEQEERRVWRVLYWHLKAMFEAADAGVIDIRDVIMPYVVLKDNCTLGDHVRARMPELRTVDPRYLLSGST